MCRLHIKYIYAFGCPTENTTAPARSLGTLQTSLQLQLWVAPPAFFTYSCFGDFGMSVFSLGLQNANHSPRGTGDSDRHARRVAGSYPPEIGLRLPQPWGWQNSCIGRAGSGEQAGPCSSTLGVGWGWGGGEERKKVLPEKRPH